MDRYDNDNDIQNLLMQIFRLSSFNDLNANQVADWLEANREKWLSMFFTRDVFKGCILRDLPSGYFNASTLMLWVPEESANEVLDVAVRQWEADEAGEIKRDERASIFDNEQDWLPEKHRGGTVLRIWWD